MHELTLVDTPGIPSESTRAALGCAGSRPARDGSHGAGASTAASARSTGCAAKAVDVESTVDVIVNKHDGRSSKVTPKRRRGRSAFRLRAVLPRDDVTALGAANAGKPLGEVKPGGVLERAIAGLVAPTLPAADASSRRPGFLRLFG
jgi:hypothetical protein